MKFHRKCGGIFSTFLRVKALKYLEENLREDFGDLGLNKDILGRTQKNMNHKRTLISRLVQI